MLRRFLRDRRGDFAQFAFVAPVLMLVSLGLVNLALLGIAGVSANNAANYGARVGSVAQDDTVGRALAAAQSKLAQSPAISAYNVSVSSNGRGGVTRVVVTYEVENYFAGLSRLFGWNSPDMFQKTVVAVFRQEGW